MASSEGDPIGMPRFLSPPPRVYHIRTPTRDHLVIRPGSNMNPSAAPPIQRGPLLASFSVLLLPAAATLLLPGQHIHFAGPLWLLALAPTLHLAYLRGWPGAAMAMALSVALLVLVHVAAGIMVRPVPENLPWVLPLLLIMGLSFGWFGDRLRREAGQPTERELTDPVTGLPSGAQARLLLENEFWAARRGRPVAVVLFELDGFSRYLATEGDAAADQALASFGDILNSTTRRMNLSARLGPARFMSILDGSDDEGALGFAERVREAFAGTTSGGHGLLVSAGIAGYQPSMSDPGDLAAAAELALQRAREAGGDCVRLFGRPASAAGSTTGAREVVGTARKRSSRGPAIREGQIESTLQGQGRTVLLVEEETSIRTLMATHLQKRGCEVEEAHDASEGMAALAREFDVVITDLRLPGLPGHDLVSAVKARWPETPVIVITGVRDSQLTADALSAGADRYLFKPFSMEELEKHLSELLIRRDDRVARHRELSRDLSSNLRQTPETRDAIVEAARALVRAVEVQDPYTEGSGVRVGSYALALLDGLGPDGPQVDREGLRLAAELRDVGKIAVPDAILNKPSPLTADEYRLVREHPRASRRILDPLLGDELIVAVAAWHHERWDGTGYPDRLAGEAIPLPARIVAISDSLDAMTSPRAYRTPLDWDDAVEQIRARTGTHFDPGLQAALQAALPELKEVYAAAFPSQLQKEDTSSPETTNETRHPHD